MKFQFNIQLISLLQRLLTTVFFMTEKSKSRYMISTDCKKTKNEGVKIGDAIFFCIFASM